MLTSLEKTQKILRLEIQNGFANRAIIGGLEKILPTLLSDLTKEKVALSLREKLENAFSKYSLAPTAIREQMVHDLIKAIQEEYKGEPSSETPALQSSSKIQTTHLANNPIEPALKVPGQKNVGLNAPLNLLSKIGASRAADFQTLGVNNIGELLYFFPRRYDDYSTLKPINRLEFGDVLTIIATVQSHLITKINNRELSRIEVVVSDGTGYLRLSFFRGSRYAQNFAAQFHQGKQLVISGKVEMYLGRKQMNDPSFEELDHQQLSTNGIIPVYSLTSGLSQKIVRLAIHEVINSFGNRIQDFLPESIRNKADLVDLKYALNQIHYPKDFQSLKIAQERLAFDEIFLLQLGVLRQKMNWVKQKANVFTLQDDAFDRLVSLLPFELTQAQITTIKDIKKDLSSGSPMNRLLQGDVGSGKTIVAALAVAIIVNNQAQAVIMAPTSILAEQHYRTLKNVFCDILKDCLEISVEEIRLLTGDTPPKEREKVKQGLMEGSVKLVIGTHALIEDPIQFQNLQLAIIDEQHRFGVAQRSALRKKGENPHLLVMSATPIPRSLALTLYGDLELSVMDEMPLGRQPIDTYVLNPLERERAYCLLRKNAEKGLQAFIVYPLIEQGDNDEVKAAVADQKVLQEEIFPDLKIGLLHGRMTPEEKESVMKAFRDKEYHILVSTTVIEVGVDIPNATMMMIEGANRFGLAQLHQLRGRVGRGSEKAMCLLLPDTEDALENERLMAMTETNDGFVLAEKDLQQRGPGDFIGYRQSGFADLRMARITDIRLIEKARDYAEDLFNQDPLLSSPENALLLNKVNEFWHSDHSDMS